MMSPMEDWKEWRDVSQGPYDNELPTDQAWRMISDWKTTAREIGVLFVSQLGTLRALAIVTSAADGAVQLSAEAATASFNLRGATFMYRPMQTWPRWPHPPIVEIMALHALLPHGTWLCMAEGLKPDAIPPRMLPGPNTGV
jgi:hypothetical protein